MAGAALTMAPQDCREEKIIGIKLDISPDILPRDTSIGTKLFMLVPNEAKNVREVKSYIANFVLKTPSPFHFFMGEYRIRDEEDAQIFSIINEPCRLVPVPIPRSALSSTPKRKSTDKRVTFFGGDLSASPVHGSTEDTLDVVDRAQAGRNIISPPDQLDMAQSIKIDDTTTNDVNDEQADLSDSSSERKKRRRRRHRSKKSKSSPKENAQDDNLFNGSESISETKSCAAANNSSDSSLMNTPDCDSQSTSNFGRNHLDVLNEETESEDETAGGTIPVKDFEFITPITSVKSRKRADNAEAHGGKKKKLSDSAFESSCSFTSPIHDSSSSSTKSRQDTPIPRVVRNPRVFDSARKIIDMFTTDHVSDESHKKGEIESSKQNSFIKTKVKVESQDISEIKAKRSDDCYQSLKHIRCAEEVNVGDDIAFKVLELDERYNPTISAYKEGVVSGKMGTQFRINYTKNTTVVRSGKYELVDDNEDADAENVKEEIELHFAELVEPKFISHRETSDGISGELDGQANQLVEGNGHSSPPSVI